jgi:hypothetical protein
MALTEGAHATVDSEFMPLYHGTVREEIEGTRIRIVRRAADFLLGKRVQVYHSGSSSIGRFLRCREIGPNNA